MIKRHLLLTGLLTMLLAWRAEAQFTPQGFSYQCIVRDDNGASLNNQTVSLLFTIRSGAPNGPVSYSEMQTTSTNEFGLVNLFIGQGTPLQGSFTSINWGGSAKYLTVSVETAPNVFDELGTTQLMSVPYALYAQNTANSGDDWGSQSVQTSPVLQGNGTAGNPLTLAQQGASIGQILKWNGTAWVPQPDETGPDGTVTEIITGAGLTGGPITTSGTISLENTAVSPGLYGSSTQIPVISVDEYGRVTDVFTVTPQPASVGITGATGINVAQNGLNFTITNTGDTDATDDITITSQADGDISGPFSNLQIKSNAVSSPEIADNAINTSELSDGAVTAPKLNSMGATSGQVLKWTGTTWAPAADALGSTSITGGTGINVAGGANNFTITNTGDTDPSDDLTNISVANGDITGPFSNLQIKPDVVGTTELASNAVATVKIAPEAVTGEKIAQMNAANGQVLKWNGSTWAPAPDNLGTVTITGGVGIDVIAAGNNYTIANNGDINPFDDVTVNSTAGGDLTGTFDNLQIKQAVVTNFELATNSVSTIKIQDEAVTGDKIGQMNALNGHVLKWNGTTWAPAIDNAGDNWGSQTVSVLPSISGNGTLANPLTLAQQNATTGQVLKWNGAAWTPAADNDSGGDDWGAQAAVTSIELEGDGTGGNPLRLADNSAAIGQVLKFDGSLWLPADDAGGDDWGTQSALVNSTLTGNGTTGSELGIAQQGAGLGQVLKWNGATWAPAADNDSGGDDWGTQTAFTSLELEGNGTSGNPLRLADNSAAIGQVLKFNGTLWLPGDDNDSGADDWGTQSALVNSTLTGNGTTGSELGIAQQGAGLGQVLKWNGTTWAPAADNDSGGDDWGTQTAFTSLELDGNGTSGDPLRLADNSANIGQVLKFDGTLWLPADDEGDDWGAQAAVTDATIKGDGSAGNALGLADQSALIGQVLKFNGTTWVPSDDNTGTGPSDNWGTQVALTNATLEGNGTVGDPLGLSQQGAGVDQVLKWNGTTWAPADDLSDLNTYAAGSGIDITGSAPNFVIENTGDLDATNELQTISLTGDELTLSNGGGTVNLPPSNNYTAGNGIDISGTAPNFTIENTGDADADPANELQTIGLSGNELTLSNGGGTVILPAVNNYAAGTGINIAGTAPNYTIENTGDADADPANELQNLTLNGNILKITGTNSSVDFDTLITAAGIGLWQGIGNNIRNGNSGNVGIGLDTPLAQLHIMGDQNALFLEGAEPTLSFTKGGTPLASLSHSPGSYLMESLDSSAIILSTSGGKALVVDGISGNVGIGDANSGIARLKVKQTDLSGGLMIENALGGFWEFRSNAATGGLILFNNTLGQVPAGFFAPNGVYTPSDRRLKKDVAGLSAVLDKIIRLEPVRYHYNPESAESKTSLGFIAQDVEAIFPELVGTSTGDDGIQYLALNYAGFSVLAIKAIQEQQKQIEALEGRNAAMLSQLNALEARVQRIEQAGARAEK
ncbi:MAG: tail fiber domain-containing protein [Saprospiraceae bacterium]